MFVLCFLFSILCTFYFSLTFIYLLNDSLVLYFNATLCVSVSRSCFWSFHFPRLLILRVFISFWSVSFSRFLLSQSFYFAGVYLFLSHSFVVSLFYLAFFFCPLFQFHFVFSPLCIRYFLLFVILHYYSLYISRVSPCS